MPEQARERAHVAVSDLHRDRLDRQVAHLKQGARGLQADRLEITVGRLPGGQREAPDQRALADRTALARSEDSRPVHVLLQPSLRTFDERVRVVRFREKRH